MANISNILKFYKDCYSFDYRSVNVKNFFGREARNILLIENLSLLSDPDTNMLVDSNWGQKVLKELAIHGKEKGLYAGALFLMGRSTQLGRTIRVAPPLYLYEVNLTDHFGNHRVNIDLDGGIINPYFLEYLKTLYPNLDIAYEEFAASLPLGPLGVAEIILIETSLEKFFPELNIKGLQKWYIPHAKLENVRFQYKQNQDESTIKLHCGIVIGILKKQEGSRGVINELDQLSNRDIHKNILNELFQGKIAPNNTFKKIEIEVPIPLSQRQKDVFHNVNENNISLVIGPPGTGKSYTISALATDLIKNGKSVLIASKNAQAGKVIAKKIENDVKIKGIVIKAARKSYKHHLSNRLSNILSGIQRNAPPSKHQILQLQKNISKESHIIEELIEELQKLEKTEYDWGLFFKKFKDGFFEKFRKKWITYRHKHANKIWRVKEKIDQHTKFKNQLIRKYIKSKYEYKLDETLKSYRKDIQNFAKTLHSKHGQTIQEHFKNTNFNNVLKAIPAWIINTTDAHHILPLDEKIFDVLILDEATQCDVASCLPLIYRAKKIVIIGDPKQLRHISFLSKRREEILNQQYHLSGMQYRDYSILDLVSEMIPNQNHITFLNEHFRSFPDIISFSNKMFYNESLHLMTATPITNIQKHLFIHQVKGVRNGKGENPSEAEAIIKKIRLIVDNEKEMDTNLSSKIGVLSPFRAQVSLLKFQIKNNFSLDEIKKHHILIGTPYHFQGEERDVMLLSFVLDKSSHGSIFTYLNRPDVFNVSITRARNLQIIYTSISEEYLNEQLLLREYLIHIENDRKSQILEERNEDLDRFTQEVIQTLKNWKVDRINTSYAISGVIIDIVVVNNHRTYCIDLIGYPGTYQQMFTQNQLNMLDRMGHKVFFLPYSEWVLNYDQTLEYLYQFIFKV